MSETRICCPSCCKPGAHIYLWVSEDRRVFECFQCGHRIEPGL